MVSFLTNASFELMDVCLVGKIWTLTIVVWQLDAIDFAMSVFNMGV